MDHDAIRRGNLEMEARQMVAACPWAPEACQGRREDPLEEVHRLHFAMEADRDWE